MFGLTILNILLGAFGVHLTVDGLKTWLSAQYERLPLGGRKALPFVVAFVGVALVRGFDMPESGIGWLWFLVLVVLLGVLAQGYFRLVKRFES